MEEKSPNVYNRLYDNYSYCLSVAEGWSTEKNDSANKQKVFENELLDMMTMGLYNIGFQISDREEYIKTELLKKDRQASVIGGQFLGLAGSFKIGAGLSQPKIGVPGGAKVPKKLPKLPRFSKAKTTPKVTTNTPKVPTATGGKTHYRLKKLSPGSEAKRFKVVEGRSRGLGSGEINGDVNYEIKHKPSSGVKLKVNPDKTTTILGRYDKDTQAIIEELKIPKSIDFSGNKGGFNLLNTPDDLYVSPEQFWNDYNKPFIDAAIERGDDIVMVTTPVRKNLIDTTKGDLTGFGREYYYLLDNGYIFDKVSKMMIKVK